MTARVTATDSARAAILDDLAIVLHQAKREFAVVGTAQSPTPWDCKHAELDGLLTDLELLDGLASRP